jgi:hypothetical protein
MSLRSLEAVGEPETREGGFLPPADGPVGAREVPRVKSKEVDMLVCSLDTVV